MLIRKTYINQLMKALEVINTKYEDNMDFKRVEKVSNSRGGGETWRVTLKPKNARNPGGRTGFFLTSKGNPMHVSAGCWHAHGDFFDALLKINPEIVIQVAGPRKIYKNKYGENEGNWEDRNIGSLYQPMYYSSACHCGEPTYPDDSEGDFE